MGLSDEILARPATLEEIRAILKGLLGQLGARSAFLVDEQGTPFAALGSVEFSYPHPLQSLASGAGGAELLEALVGERAAAPRAGGSPLLVVRVGSRALLALLLEQPSGSWRRRRAAARARRAAEAIAVLVEGPRPSGESSL